MLSSSSRLPIRLFVAALAFVSMHACDNPSNEGACKPGDFNLQGTVCSCTDDTGAYCEATSDNDSCECAFREPSCAAIECPDPTTNPDLNPGLYRFVLVEDLTQGASGPSPGADIDAIVVTKADGTIMPATTFEDFGGIGEGDFTNPSDALGLPDSNCEVTNFVALGGVGAGGYIVVGFADNGSGGLFTSGDTITVHEIGSTMCPNNTYDDDPYAVSVSVSKDLSTFVEIATNVLGNVPVTIPAQDSNKSIERRAQEVYCCY